MSKWHTFDSREKLDADLAQQLASSLRQDIRVRGEASFAVSGGSTPKGMFQQLSRCELDWNKVDVFLVDERWVAPDSPDSNERLVRENLIQNQAASARLCSFKTSDVDPEDGIPELTERLEAIARPFSAVVLGMGGDGHTASWFPQAVNLKELLDPDGTSKIAATHPVTAPHQRITLTFPAVVRSQNIIIHVAGDEKKTVLEGAVAARFPIAAILEQTITPVTIWWAP
jgi:6-phosphogluconolactonase